MGLWTKTRGSIPGPWETGINIIRMKELEAIANISRTFSYLKASLVLAKRFMSPLSVFK